MKATIYTGSFADRLSDLIDRAAEKGITLRDIEKATGVKKESLSKYQNNKAEPGLNNVVTLAKYFNVSTDYLLALSDTQTNDTNITAIGNYTGLSAKAIEILNYNQNYGLYNFRAKFISDLLEEDYDKNNYGLLSLLMAYPDKHFAIEDTVQKQAAEALDNIFGFNQLFFSNTGFEEIARIALIDKIRSTLEDFKSYKQSVK